MEDVKKAVTEGYEKGFKIGLKQAVKLVSKIIEDCNDAQGCELCPYIDEPYESYCPFAKAPKYWDIEKFIKAVVK